MIIDWLEKEQRDRLRNQYARILISESDTPEVLDALDSLQADRDEAIAHINNLIASMVNAGRDHASSVADAREFIRAKT